MIMDENTRVVHPGATRIARAAHSAKEKLGERLVKDTCRCCSHNYTKYGEK